MTNAILISFRLCFLHTTRMSIFILWFHLRLSLTSNVFLINWIKCGGAALRYPEEENPCSPARIIPWYLKFNMWCGTWIGKNCWLKMVLYSAIFLQDKSCGKDCRQVMPVDRSRLSWIFLKAKNYNTVQEMYHLPVLRYHEILIYASIKINDKIGRFIYV